MLFLKYLLMWGGIGMIAVAAGILAYDIYLEMKYRQALAVAGAGPLPPTPVVRWRGALALALLAWGPIVLALGIVVVPSGTAGVRVSQSSGTLPGTLYPGAHFLVPLAENVVLFDTRDQLFTTGALENAAKARNPSHSTCRRKRGSLLDCPSPYDTGSIRSISTTFRPTCHSRSKRKSCRRS